MTIETRVFIKIFLIIRAQYTQVIQKNYTANIYY
jgi:hypothetical protein